MSNAVTKGAKRPTLPEFDTMPKIWEWMFSTIDTESIAAFYSPIEDRYSYKRISAYAHCMAAFFLSKGLKIGDSVVLISHNHPVYNCIEISLNFCGVVNHTFDFLHNITDVIENIERIKPHFVIVTDYIYYKKNKEWIDKIANKRPVLCLTNPKEQTDEVDKIITIESAYYNGKEFWRENRELLKQRQKDISPTNIATVLYDKQKTGEKQVVSHLQVANKLSELYKLYKDAPQAAIFFSFLSPESYLERLAGQYLPLLLDCPVYYYGQTIDFKKILVDIKRFKPYFISNSPESSLELAQYIKMDFGRTYSLRKQYLPRAFERAEKVRKTSADKAPFGLMLAYKWSKKMVLNKIKLKYFQSVNFLLTENSESNDAIVSFYDAIGIQPKFLKIR